MSGYLQVLGWLLLVPVAVPVGVFLIEVLLGLLPARRPIDGHPARFAIIMPAHDEAPTIGRFVAPLVASLPAGARLLVVADNCGDATATVARSAGAEVVERHDPSRRGKGFALAHGRDQLERDPPDVVIILDADCHLMGGGDAAARLAGVARALNRPVQARYTFAGGHAEPAMVQVSNFALLVKNLVRQRGLARLGAPALLGGTGMAFPWAQFAGAALASDEIVEDLTLGLALAEAGTPARYLDAVHVTSAASSAGGTLIQRTRWEHGFLDVARRHGLRLLRLGLTTRRPALVWTGLHLMTPPLALLVGLMGMVMLAEALLWLGGAGLAPFLVSVGLFLLIAAAVMASWLLHGRATLAARTLLRLPLYIVWKLPVYLGFLRRREKAWVRTERAEGSGPSGG